MIRSKIDSFQKDHKIIQLIFFTWPNRDHDIHIVKWSYNVINKIKYSNRFVLTFFIKNINLFMKKLV